MLQDEEKNVTESQKSFSPMAYITVVQSVAILIILLSVLIIKLFFGNFYLELKNKYENSFLSDTKVSEVLGEDLTGAN